MSAITQNFQGSPYLYPTTQAVPNSQQVVIPQITIPQTLTPYVPQNNSFLPQQGVMPYRVKNLDEAKAFQTQPNSMYALFLEDDDVFYIKTTDKNNYPTSLKRYRFVEEEEPVPAPPPEYVTVEEFNKFKEEMQSGKQSIRSQPANNAGGIHETRQSANSNAR